MSAKRMADLKLDTITARIPAALNVRLKAEAVIRKTTQSEIVRLAIETYMNNIKSNPVEAK